MISSWFDTLHVAFMLVIANNVEVRDLSPLSDGKLEGLSHVEFDFWAELGLSRNGQMDLYITGHKLY